MLKKYASLGYIMLAILAPLSNAFPNANYKSQFRQDAILNEMFFKNRSGGTFVDIGAHDGVSFSNSYFYEKELGWKGICIEPLSGMYEKLKSARSCVCVNGVISQKAGMVKFREVEHKPEEHTEYTPSMLSGIEALYDPRHMQTIAWEVRGKGVGYKIIDVPSYRLNDLLDKYKLATIDYLSIDTEGGELEILKSINFDLHYIYVIDVENNFADTDIRVFLEGKGFAFVQRCVCDEIYVNTKAYQVALEDR